MLAIAVSDPLYIDDLENLIDESMVLSFNSEIEDGSVEEVICFSYNADFRFNSDKMNRMDKLSLKMP